MNADTQAVAYCVDPDCRCDHRYGVVVDDAEGWAQMPGYVVVQEPVRESAPAKY